MRLVATIANSVLPKFARDAIKRAVHPIRSGRAFFKPYVIHKHMEGEEFDFLIGDRVGRAWYDYESVNNPRWLEMRFIRTHVIQPGDVVLECGGHHGCSAILLSRWVGAHGKVISFEPSAENCDIFEKNIRLNAIANVELHRKAVGAEEGVIVFDESESGINPAGRGGASVPVVTLDSFSHVNPTLLKIDIEGFELEALKGARTILAGRPKLALEIHADQLRQYGGTVREIFEVIGFERYKSWVQWRDDQEPEMYDGRAIESRAHLFCLPV
jgi:FkbM family methyltransferase